MRWFLYLLSLFALPLFAATPVTFEVIERVEQSPTLFTQGLEIHNERFYLSSGLYNKSFLLTFTRSDNDGKRLDVPANVFAEGLTIYRGKLYLLSWQEQMAWRFNASTLELERTFRYSGEGWGLSHTASHLVLSDGSATLKFLNPENFHVVRKITVTDGNNPVDQLNELEFAEGMIWANRWRTTLIYAIDPDSGQALFAIDLKPLQQEAAIRDNDSVANGIAYDEQRKAYWVTGKYWRYRYLINVELPK